MRFFLPALLILIIVLSSPSAKALIFRVSNTSTQDRFTGFPSSPIPNPNFIHAATNLTGVGYHTGGGNRAVTLITPKHIVYARHFRLGAGSLVRFIAADGTIVERSIISNSDIDNPAGLATDLSLAEFNEAIPESSGISHQTYFNNVGSLFVTKEIIVIGRDVQGGISNIQALINLNASNISGFNDGVFLQHVYDTTSGDNDDCYFEVGDSGGSTLVDVNGRGAILSINGLVNTDSTPINNFGVFVPNTPYIDQLNTLLLPDGYQMEQANPQSTTLTLNVIAPSVVIRAGHPATFNYTVTNTNASITANNITLRQPLDAGATTTSSGSNWVETSTPTLFDFHRGKLTGNESSTASSTITYFQTGTVDVPVSLHSDESPEITQTVQIQVIESFLSFAQNLTNPATTDDEDGDGIINLLEYAFGGNPSTHSDTQDGNVISLLPETTPGSSQGSVNFRFLRRTDAATRGLTYTVQESSTLESSTWSDITFTPSSTTDLGNGFEEIQAAFIPGSNEHFYRLKVELNETL